ncbi:protein prenylyltransferase [Nadsonia fulvescens var. elongata DSM 6958]|uniref:Protein farnesyltransferase/geranylgeranyltransferase type-1 subunit alpha n=1 Tax=Nadsonia fulvescens var. elongata DSM 6958 TaxID=857566 RepID=A0A1E3PP32_9ASCO|nr:protein prenylyltransferase [Nadsonia fulvescens var. elongata DSM 6958]
MEKHDYSDLTIIPHSDGPTPLAPILYSENYSKAMGILRALMANQELSERALDLTTEIIDQNPAHYTVWAYRVNIIQELGVDFLINELEWVDSIAMEATKNYQIWPHRQIILNMMSSIPEIKDKIDVGAELALVDTLLEDDNKNYHVWSYRQWLFNRFDLSFSREDTFTRYMIDLDVRNNSAWNYRFFLLSATVLKPSSVFDLDILAEELDYIFANIEKAPQNQSPWSYLEGVMKHVGQNLSDLEDRFTRFANIGSEGESDVEPLVRSSHALNILAKIYASKGQKTLAIKALDLLANTYDPIREGYWAYRKSQLA